MPIPLGPHPERPFVSIFVANYNYDAYVGEAIESVLAQTYTSFELIVCDDGSTDNSSEVIASYVQRDERVKLICTANSGQGSAWNTAWSQSKGEIICTLDADDTFRPDKLERVVRHFAEHPSSGLAIHPLMVIDQFGQAIMRIPFMTGFEEGWIAERVMRRGGRWRYLPASALCFRREIANHVFPIPAPLFRRTADGFVFTLAPLLAPVSSIPDILGCYRVHGSNGMSSSRLDARSADRVLSAIERITQGVNQRLSELGFADGVLELRRNLAFLEHSFQRALFDRVPRRQLVSRYLVLLANLWADDLYSRSQKALGMVVYAVALMLPAPVRSLWLSQTIGFTRTKHVVQSITGTLRRLSRPSGFRRQRDAVTAPDSGSYDPAIAEASHQRGRLTAPPSEIQSPP